MQPLGSIRHPQVRRRCAAFISNRPRRSLVHSTSTLANTRNANWNRRWPQSRHQLPSIINLSSNNLSLFDEWISCESRPLSCRHCHSSVDELRVRRRSELSRPLPDPLEGRVGTDQRFNCRKLNFRKRDRSERTSFRFEETPLLLLSADEHFVR